MICDLHGYYKGVCTECMHMKYRADKKAEKDAEKLAKKILAQKAAQSKPKARVKPVSDKMKEKNQAYSNRVKEWKMENPHCKAKVATQCNGITRDCHHMKKRGDLLMVEKYWLPVCGACHQWIGDNSEEARNRGLTINHLEPEFVEPHKI